MLQLAVSAWIRLGPVTAANFRPPKSRAFQNFSTAMSPRNRQPPKSIPHLAANAGQSANQKPRGKWGAEPRGKSDVELRGRSDAKSNYSRERRPDHANQKPRGKWGAEPRGKSDVELRGRSDAKSNYSRERRPGHANQKPRGKANAKSHSSRKR